MKNNLINNYTKTVLVGVLIILGNFFYGNFVFEKQFKEFRIYSDAYDYYSYLPALFVHGDITTLQGFSLPNGNEINKYNYGVAFFEMPVFLVQLKLAKYFDVSEDIYEIYYARGVLLSASIYLFFGLLILYHYLKRLFGAYTSVITVAIIFLGTNFFYYTNAQSGMSHVYTFFCMCGVLHFTELAFKSNYIRYHIINAVFIGFVIVIRPINIPVVLFFLFYDLYTFNHIKNKVIFYMKNLHLPLLYFTGVVIVFIPQMIYWKIVTGNFLVYSYGYNNEGFTNWESPKLWDVFFGVQCSWLPYTPVMAFAIIGLFFLIYKKTHNGLAIGITFMVIYYICASWWCNFSCSLGYRSFTEYYPLLAIPLAWFIKVCLVDRSKILAMLFTVCMIYINLAITYYFTFQGWAWCQDIWSWKYYWIAMKLIFPFLFDY